MTADFSPYAEFFAHEWQSLLAGVNADWSWDRKACYLYLTTTQGSADMAGKPRGRKPAQNQTAALLNAALDYLSIIPDKAAAPNNVVINGALITVNNGLLKAGIMIGGEFPSDVVAKVPMGSLAGALARVGKDMELVFGEESLSLSSGDFKAELELVPINMEQDRANPDANIAPLSDTFKTACTTAGRLASDTAEELLTSTVMTLGATVMATKRHTIIEAWHGNDMPGGICLPKAFVTALGKAKLALKGFGFSERTFTVHFDGGAFLQTNIYGTDAWSIPDKEPNFFVNRAYQMLADDEGSVFVNPAKLADDFKAIMAVSPVDVAVVVGKLMTTDGMVSLDAPDMLDSFIIAPERFVAVVDLMGTAKLVKTALPWTIRFSTSSPPARGVVIVSEVHQEAPAPQPAWAGPAPTPNPPLVPPAPAFSPPATPATSAPFAAPAPMNPAPVQATPVNSGPTAFPSSSGGLFGDDDA